MRVLFASGIFPPEAGGPATFVPQLATEMTRRGHEVVVVTNGEPAPEVDAELPFEVVRVTPGGYRELKYARQVKTLLAAMRRFEPDVALSNAFDWQAVTVAKLTRTPVATKVVGDMAWERAKVRYGLDDDIESFNDSRYSPRVEFLRTVRTFQTRFADRVVVPSHYLEGLVEGWGVPAERVSVVSNAVDVDVDPAPLEEREPRIVTACRLVDWKGVEGLVDAVAELRSDVPAATLHVLGDGPDGETIQSYAAEYLDPEGYTFHGRVSQQRVLEMVAESRVFALNSTYEGLPHAVLEAMAAGTPAVVSDAGGNPEVVADGESGFVVPQGDSDAFAARFRRLLEDDEQWRAFSEAGTRRLSDHFDRETMLDEYERILETVADR